MKEQLIEKYVDKISKEDIKRFGNSNSIFLCDEEVDILYTELKKNYIFIKQFWNCNEEDSFDQINRLEEQYHNNKKDIEMSVNTWSIGDFFVGESSKIMDNDKIIIQFANAIAYFWDRRVKELFPDREIVVKLDNDLMGEFGLCVTMYEDVRSDGK